jgi:hypothetical protein
MPDQDRQSSPTPGGLSRHLLLVGLVVMTLAVGVLLFAFVRDDPVSPASPPSAPPSAEKVTPSSTTILGSRNEVVARLREILQIREQAFRERDASLFEDVYTSDCSCLRAGRDAIAALKKENVRWRNRSVSIDIQSATSINDDLWEIVATFFSDPFRIETEEGVLVREAPAERLRYRFLLVRTSDADSWRLGNASLVKG